LDPSEAQTKVTGAEKQLRTAQENVDWAKAKKSQAEKGLDAAKLVRDAVLKSTSSGEVDRARAKAAAILAEGAVEDATGAVKTAEAKVAEAEALVAQAKLGMKYTTIKVPSFQFAEGKPDQPAIGKVQLDGDNQRPKRNYKVLERKVELGQNIDAKQV